MNAKSLFLAGCLVLLFLKANSQYPRIYMRAGVTLFTTWLSHTDDNIAIVPAFSVSPGIRLIQTKNFAVSVTLPVSGGFSTKSNNYLGFDLPAMLEIHLGSAAANNENGRWGFLLGGGAGYNYAGNYWAYENIESDFWGYRFEAGISFKSDGIGNTPMILISYGRGIADGRQQLIGIGLHLVIGYKN